METNMWGKTQNRNKKIMLITGLILIFLLIYFRNDFNLSPENTIAKVGNKIVYKQELELFLKEYPTLNFKQFKNTALDYIVAQEVISEHTKNTGEFEIIAKNYKNALVNHEYNQAITKEYIKKFINPKTKVSLPELKKYYASKKPISVYFLFVSFSENNAIQKIQKAKSLLEEGFDFFDVQKQYADAQFIGKQSFAGYYYPKSTKLDANFNNYINQLSGYKSHSQIFSSDTGYVILYQGKNPEFDEIKNDLMATLISQKKEKALLDLKQSLNKNIKIRNEFLARLGYTDDLKQLLNNPIATVNSKQVFFKDFYYYCLYILNIDETTFFANTSKLNAEVNDFLQALALKQLAAKNKIGTAKSFKINQQIKVNKITNNLVPFVFEKYLENKGIKVTETEIKNYYNQNLSNLTQPSLLKLQKIVLKSKSDASKVYYKLKKDSNFNQKVVKYSIDKSKNIDYGIMPFKTYYELEPIYEKLSNLKVNDIAKPLKFEDKWHIFKLLEKQKAGHFSLDQAYNYAKIKLLLQKLEPYLKNIKSNLKIKTFYKRI